MTPTEICILSAFFVVIAVSAIAIVVAATIN